MRKVEQIQRPSVDDFARVKQISKEIKSIIEKIDFIENPDNKRVLLNLCDDVLFFLESQQPKLFIMYAAHAFRELTEKFFGISKSVDNETYFSFNTKISENLLKLLDVTEIFTFIESRDGHKIKLKGLIKLKERDELLKLSCDDIWHSDVWELNNRYKDQKSSKRELGTIKFYKSVPAKYSLSVWTYEELMKSRSSLYGELSAYAHGKKVYKLITVFEKKEDERSEKDKGLLNEYLETTASVIDIFRPFELTTNEKIKKIDDLLNE